MKKNVVTLIAAIAFVTLIIWFGMRATRAAHQQAQAGSMDQRLAAFVNKPAPDFELTSLEGKQVKLSDYRGKAVVLNFWATWCGPCKVEMPWLVDLEKKYADQGVQIVGVSMDDESKDKVADFAKQMGLNYPVLMGKEALSDKFGGLDGLPTTFYIDRNGKVVESVAGLISKSEIEQNIKRALGKA